MAEVIAAGTPTSPLGIAENVSAAGVTKASLPLGKMFFLSVLAGMYISFGGIFSTLAGVGMEGDWPYGFMKVFQGLAFSLGLILVVVGGAELFTGNMLMIIPLLEGKIKTTSLLRNWIIVYLGNFAGSILIAFLVLLSRIYMNSDGQLGQVMLSVATRKIHYGFLQAIVLGILCNILVCLAVWLSYSAKNATDKIIAVIFPITAFIAAGFEHSVANMYLIPVALLVKWFDPAFASSVPISNLGLVTFLWNNLLPVTIGNIIGGSFIVGLAYFLSYGRKSSK